MTYRPGQAHGAGVGNHLLPSMLPRPTVTSSAPSATSSQSPPEDRDAAAAGDPCLRPGPGTGGPAVERADRCRLCGRRSRTRRPCRRAGPSSAPTGLVGRPPRWARHPAVAARARPATPLPLRHSSRPEAVGARAGLLCPRARGSGRGRGPRQAHRIDPRADRRRPARSGLDLSSGQPAAGPAAPKRSTGHPGDQLSHRPGRAPSLVAPRRRPRPVTPPRDHRPAPGPRVDHSWGPDRDHRDRPGPAAGTDETQAGTRRGRSEVPSSACRPDAFSRSSPRDRSGQGRSTRPRPTWPPGEPGR